MILDKLLSHINKMEPYEWILSQKVLLEVNVIVDVNCLAWCLVLGV